MASAVYEVDHETRLVMPDTDWSCQVLGKIVQQGHAVIKVGESPELVARVERERTQAELDRRDILVAGTGIAP